MANGLTCVCLLGSNLNIHAKPDKTGNLRITSHSGAFTVLLLPWKSNKFYIFTCVRAHACLRPGRVGVCMRVRACSLAYLACNSYVPYCDFICDLSGSIVFFDIIS
jgi:hypothetical protein